MPMHTTQQPQNIAQGVSVVYITAHTRTILAHDASHCKNLENRDTEIFRLVDSLVDCAWHV